jgi:hypothetical protein
MVFLIHSVIQYPAKVMKTINPITFAEEQLLPLLDEHAGLLAFPLGLVPYRNKSDREPSAKSERNETTNCADRKHMPKPFGNIHCLLKHHHTERNPRYPTDKTNNGEDTEYGEYDRSGIVMLGEVVNGSPKTEENMEYACDPDKLLGERPSQCEVEP